MLGAYLRTEFGQRRPAVLDLGQAFRALGVQGRLVAGQFGGDVVEQGSHLPCQAAAATSSPVVVFGDVLQGVLRGVHQRGGVGFLAEVLGDQGLVGGAGGDPQLLDVGRA